MIRDMRRMAIPMKSISEESMATEALTADTATDTRMPWMINIMRAIPTPIAHRFIPIPGAGVGTVHITVAIHATIFGLDIHTAADGVMVIPMVGAMMAGIATDLSGMILIRSAMVMEVMVATVMAVMVVGGIPGMAIQAMVGEPPGMDMADRIIDPIGTILTTVMVVDIEWYTGRE